MLPNNFKINIMSNLKTIIAGAQYFDNNTGHLVVPHYTGEFFMVDCDTFMPLNELKETYDEEWVNENEDNYREFEGEKYYYAENPPYGTEEFDLISDISSIRML